MEKLGQVNVTTLAIGGVAILGIGYVLATNNFFSSENRAQESTLEMQNAFLKAFDVDGDIAALESGALARINVSGRHLRPNECKILTSILHRPAVASRLAILDLSAAKIGVQGTRELVAALPDLTHLKEFRLSDNKLGPKGVVELAAALRGLEHLHTLVLSRNGIGKEGVKELGPSLRGLTKLHTLGLGGNDLCAEGAKELASAIRGLSQLRIINLSNNNLGDEGVKFIAMVLPSLTKLQTLNLTGVSVGADGQKVIDDSRESFVRLSIYT